jgi:probable phosphoglycerate mutase
LRLVEWAWGDWEGRSIDALLADPASGYVPFERWGWERRPPGGESPADGWRRVAPLLAGIAAAGRPTVIVAHRGLMRVILARAWGWAFEGPEPFAIKRGRLLPLALDAAGRPRAPEPPERLVER